MAIRSLLIKDIKDLEESMNGSISYVDIDYDIQREPDDPWTTKTRATIMNNHYAILNAYRMWLQSRRYDYIRAPTFGGLFDHNMNDRCTFGPENEEVVKSIVMQESAEKWPDINILDCDVTAIVPERKWHIRIVAQDKNTKMVLADDNLRISHIESDPGTYIDPNARRYEPTL